MTEPRSPDELMAMVRAFQESRVLLTALELDVFTLLSDGADGADAAAIARRAGTDPRATAALLNALVSLGALVKEGDVFRCTPASRALGPARAGLLHTADLWESWSSLTDAVRRGTAVVRPGVEAHRDAWTESFIAAMHARATTEAAAMVAQVPLAGPCRMLDVGGGSGAFAIAFARAHAELRAEIFDLAPVTAIASRHVAAAGLADRVTVRVGDLRRDELGEGHDLVLLSAINHMLDEPENRALLARCARALRPGGRLVIREFILDPDRAGPKRAALFALNMLVGTRGGSTYTEGDYRAWLEAAGFEEIARPDPGGDLLLATRRAAGG